MRTTPRKSSARCCQGLYAGGYARSRRTVLYNTCSIRDKAEQKVFHRLQQFKREAGKGKVFAVIGCVAQQEGEKIFEKAPHVSLVAGSASYTKLPEMLVQLEAGNRRVTGLSLDTDETFDTPFTRRDNPHRAYITIIEGCDKCCAYCVVPFTRGPERSRTSASVMEEARRLGRIRDTPKSSCWGRTSTAIAILRPPAGISPRCSTAWAKFPASAACASPPRIRAISSRRSSMRSMPIQRYAITCICRCSRDRPACSSAMQRLYTRDEYMRRIEWMKNARRHIAITTDIIVGFPGETEKDFDETLALLDEVQYDSLFASSIRRAPTLRR